MDAAVPSPPVGEGNIADSLRVAAVRLQNALALAPREARLEARILAAHVLGVDRAWLVAHDRDLLNPDQASAVEALIARRERGEPVAYLLGEREFFGRTFKVSPDVLIPRPETELLVEAALAQLPDGRPARVLDLGTGSGCVAISLALERPQAQIWAVDISAKALALAERNALCLGAPRLQCALGDWFEGLGDSLWDLIVSNPPYIAENDPHLDQGDLRFEPGAALASGQDGLDAIRRIAAESRVRLAPGGWLMVEHGLNQGPPCRALFAQTGLVDVKTLRDLAGLERVTLGQQPANSSPPRPPDREE